MAPCGLKHVEIKGVNDKCQVTAIFCGNIFDQLDLEPINLSMVRIKDVSADWFVQMHSYIAENPSFLVNGFLKSVITAALDGSLDSHKAEL